MGVARGFGLFGFTWAAASALCLSLAWSAPASGQSEQQATTPPAASEHADCELFENQPAQAWVEAYPIGNGSLGGMVFGDIAHGRIQLNEDTVWTGKPHSYAQQGAAEVLPEIRRLLFEGKQDEAEALAMQRFMSVPLHQKAYQPMADLWLDTNWPQGETPFAYKRTLNLNTATHTTTWQADGQTHTRRVFASFPDQAVIVDWHIALAPDNTSGIHTGIYTKLRLTSPHQSATTQATTDNRTFPELTLKGNVQADGIHFETRLIPLVCDGEMTIEGDKLAVAGANRLVFAVVADTNFSDFQNLTHDPAVTNALTVARLRKLAQQAESPQAIADVFHKRHVSDHQALFDRVRLQLSNNTNSNRQPLPTRQRLEQFALSGGDPELIETYFQFGRYLLIASTRPGSQPPNLQGIWNDQMAPPWESKYTTNINTEMNHWPAEVTNLAECTQPLFEAMQDLAISGQAVAKAHYNARGWVLHHNFDLWRGTAPINHADHGIWPTGSAWLCQHLWDHFLYNHNQAFLKDTAYPLMQQAAMFYLDTLVEDPNSDWLISGPSNSPEQGGLVMGPTMDHQLIRNLFENTQQAAALLGVDDHLQNQLADALKRLAPNQIGQRGQMQEWLTDVDDPNNKHRHVSHLWDVYPGHAINVETTPELADAAKTSLQWRGDEGTGWSMGWKLNLWARFRDGDHAYQLLKNQLRLASTQNHHGGGTYPNLFDAHPPFQIDGNFGATSGIAEMLLQSHVGHIDLLPALPAAWPDGSVRGLRARGGFEVEMVWQQGQLQHALIGSMHGQPLVIHLGEQWLESTTEKNDVFLLTKNDAGVWQLEKMQQACTLFRPKD